jgi:hypothetical protein
MSGQDQPESKPAEICPLSADIFASAKSGVVSRYIMTMWGRRVLGLEQYIAELEAKKDKRLANAIEEIRTQIAINNKLRVENKRLKDALKKIAELEAKLMDAKEGK